MVHVETVVLKILYGLFFFSFLVLGIGLKQEKSAVPKYFSTVFLKEQTLLKCICW